MDAIPRYIKCTHLNVFSVIFTKGNNLRDFLFASLADIALFKLGFTLKRKSLLQEGGQTQISLEKGSKYVNDRFTSPEE